MRKRTNKKPRRKARFNTRIVNRIAKEHVSSPGSIRQVLSEAEQSGRLNELRNKTKKPTKKDRGSTK